jgi:protein required for attachment to host cells
MVIINQHTWIVIANGSECKIFSANLKEKHLELLKQFYFSEVRAHNRDLGKDKPGLFHESTHSMKHGIAPKYDLQDKEKNKFVQLIANFLNDEANAQKFNSLILTSSPKFLGEIRKQLTKHTTSMILKEDNKDLVHAKEREILNYILST